MDILEKKLTEEIVKNYNLAEKDYDCKMTRMLQNIEKFGAVRTIQEILRKGKTSDCFEALIKKNRLDLTMEAVIVKPKYGQLFTDEEVNACYELLCENGYY